MEPLTKSQVVAVIKLNQKEADPREFIRRQTDHLDAGTHVRVIVGNVPAPFLGADATNPLAYQWCRLDLSWSFEPSVHRAPEWQQLSREIKAVKSWVNPK